MPGEFGDSPTSPRSLFPSLLFRLGSVLVSGWPFSVLGITSRSDDAERGKKVCKAFSSMCLKTTTKRLCLYLDLR